MKGIREPDGMKKPVEYLPNERPKICTLNCTLEFEKHLQNVLHVFHWLVKLKGSHRCN